MEYLKKVVPRMFQNTLAFLSRQMIQQFLDELIWRERYGYVSAKAFDSLIEHVAEQTKLTTGDFLLSRLQRIALNPFKNWKYSNWKINCASDETMNVSELELISSKLQKEADASTSQMARKRPAEDLSSSIDLTKTSDPIELESFYYGTVPASNVVEEGDGLPIMKCVICSYKSSDIIAMMQHLVSHAFHESSDKKDAGKNPMCRYCLRTFVTDYWLQSHLSETHFRFKNKPGLMCLICEEKFKDRTTLILHMHRNHKELELPYKCQICHYRTSQHTGVIDHFYNAHHKGETLMCPFCLKAVALASNGKSIEQNQYFFLNHIQKHRRKVLAKKCNKCVLWFVQKGLLVDHQNSDHSTCKDLENVRRLTGFVNCAPMPRPKSSSESEERPLKLTRDPVPNGSLFSKSSDLQSVQFTIPEESSTCSECESSLKEEEHFPGEFNCKQCKFVTNCYNAIIDHVTVYHDLRLEPVGGKQMGGKPFMRVTDLKEPMHCCCGFASSSGNKLAYHLLSCKKKSVYPSPMIANQNALSVTCQTPNLEDEDDPDDPDEIMEESTPNTNSDLRSIRRGRTVID
ncbi:hypothetical protein LSTR_LSTR000468 [Laodelphax striatellus]|uniref:C2H2-type domain-containing protein n=1 Tax=Laodelphax striatellus TaxID=195883 RepID=A0A482X355_LAOST|nr:hypothetical protein LSTR_LSTR000468 [Laodelphax striatellus]